MNRIPLILFLWFALWITTGFFIGRALETPGVYTVVGAFLALISVFLWPFVFPERLQDWMER